MRSARPRCNRRSPPSWLGATIALSIVAGASEAVAQEKGAVRRASGSHAPEPATLVIDAPSGAAVHVDGRRVGDAPLTRAIEVDAGSHLVSITKRGFHPQGRVVRAQAGKATRIAVELAATRQRKAAWATLGGAGAAIAGGIVLGTASVIEHRKVRSLDRSAGGASRSSEEARAYAEALARRDDFRMASGIVAGTGLGLFLVAGTLMVFDTEPAPPASDSTRAAASAQGRSVRQDRAGERTFSALPVLGTDFAGGTVTIRF